MKYFSLLLLTLGMMAACPSFGQKKVLLNTSKEVSKILSSHSKTSATKVCEIIKNKIQTERDGRTNKELDAAVIKAINLLRTTEAPKEIEADLHDLYGYTIALIMLYDDAPALDRKDADCDIAKNRLNSALRSIQTLIKNLLLCEVINYRRDFELADFVFFAEYDERFRNCYAIASDLDEKLETLDRLSERVARYCQ